MVYHDNDKTKAKIEEKDNLAQGMLEIRSTSDCRISMYSSRRSNPARQAPPRLHSISEKHDEKGKDSSGSMNPDSTCYIAFRCHRCAPSGTAP